MTCNVASSTERILSQSPHTVLCFLGPLLGSSKPHRKPVIVGAPMPTLSRRRAPMPTTSRRRAPMFKLRRSKRIRKRKLTCLPPLGSASLSPHDQTAEGRTPQTAEGRALQENGDDEQPPPTKPAEGADFTWLPLPPLCAPSLPPLARSLSSSMNDGSKQPLMRRVHISVTPPLNALDISLGSDVPHFSLSSPCGSPYGSAFGTFRLRYDWLCARHSLFKVHGR